MIVYVVEQGERYEGGHIVAICSTLEKARQIANETFQNWGWEDKKQDGDSYSGGCDWMGITQIEVED